MNNNEYVIKGFSASAVSAGLKKDNVLDLALVVSEEEATAAGVFTTNQVKAAPVILSQQHVCDGKARAIIANSGNANACSGEAGLNNSLLTADLVARKLGIGPEEVLVASTGVIGLPLDMDLISGAIPGLIEGLSPEGLPSVAKAIMTTDSFPKISHFDGKAGGLPYRILGIAKGAGMIMPNMATMLCFVLSSIRIDVHDLKRALASSVDVTFNRITVDGDTSTNDMVLALANGSAGNSSFSKADYNGFVEGLRAVLEDLSLMIVRDGEGSTKLIYVEIKGANSASDALNAAKTVANSTLVKTACYGEDPNWGRIMAALGRTEIALKEDCVDIWVDNIQIVSGGFGKGAEAERLAAEKMAEREFTLTIDLHQGAYQDRMVTCDLTHEYISINADYRT